MRTESIASSKVEGLQVDVRDLARGEARAETQGKVSPTTAEILANIDAMELAIDDAATVPTFTADQIIAIHRRLMTAARTPASPAACAPPRTGSAATTTTPAVPTSSPHHPTASRLSSTTSAAP